MVHSAFYFQHADALQPWPFGLGEQMVIAGQQRITPSFDSPMLSPDLFELTQIRRAFKGLALCGFDSVLHQP